MSTTLQEAFLYCEKIARSHYENFPIGWFLPKHSRKYLYALYAFARTADDFSDEEEYEGERLKRLDDWETKLDAALSQNSDDAILLAVAETVQKTGIPSRLLKDLLKAFRQDITKKRYDDFKDLESYCVYSANPIGRMVLRVAGFQEPRLFEYSDKICTGIQLVNHWQDIAIDLGRGRVYLPEEDLRRFGYSYDDLSQKKLNEDFRALMRFEVARTRSLFYEGRPLLDHLKGRSRRLYWQIALMWMGPMKILQRIEERQFDVFTLRPTLSRSDKIKLALRLPFRAP